MGGQQYYNMLTPQAYDPTIKWETTLTWNAGLDFGFFNSRLSGSIDAYLWPYKGGEEFAGQAFPQYKCLFPLPPTELAANPRLTQNPGY